MKRVYLLVHASATATHDKMKTILNSMQEIVTWRTDIANCFYIVSEESAVVLANALRKRVGQTGRFIISEITDNRYGWLSPDSWFLIDNKHLKPKPRAAK